MAARLQWERDGRDWPLRAASRFVRAGGLCWHVQRLGPPAAPVALLIHGTGAATHSWRDLAPLLAEDFAVIAVDLPGHGFTQLPPADALSLDGMARALGALLGVLDVQPALVVGHSAGAAIAAQMTLGHLIAPRALVSLSGALLPLGGIAGILFPPAARLMAALPFVPRLFAWLAADQAAIDRLIDGTGSRLDATGVALYARLIRNPGHAAAALGMMAHWDLVPLERALPQLRPPLTLIVGANDRTVPIEQAHKVVALVPGTRLIVLPGLGHLAHEEQPRQVGELIRAAARDAGVPIAR